MEGQRKQHWDGVYGSKQHTEVSWYQPLPEASLQFIDATGVGHDGAIIDVGGGASTLVDHLLERGYRDVSVLDVAANAFAQSRARLGDRAGDVDWIVVDVTRFKAQRKYALWHDRAVLHFLTDSEDRDRYVAALRQALAPGGFVVLASFGPEGPLRCSGLDVRRYSVAMMQELLGTDFTLLGHTLEDHPTPGGAQQQFLYTSWQRRK